MTALPSGAEGASPATAEVVVAGELDISTFDQVQRRVEEAERDMPRLLVIDLSRLEFVDSSGVRLVLQADERAKRQGRGLAVRLGTGMALRVFQALGLLDKLDVLPPDTDGATTPRIAR